MSEATIENHTAFIWSVADLLRGDYKQSEYGKVILPFTVLRRLDCVLAPTKQRVLDRAAQLEGRVDNIGPVLEKEAGESFFNTSRYDFSKLLAAPDDLTKNLRQYIASFSELARDVIDKLDLDTQISRLDRSNLLHLVVSKFAEIDLHPSAVSHREMGYLYEGLIRRSSELSNETAGEHFTPRDVTQLMVNLLLIEDEDELSKASVVKTVYDPACGTGGMLAIAEDRLRNLNPDARLNVYGQELNAPTYAICRLDMMLKGHHAQQIVLGDTLTHDGHPEGSFDYMLSNPPMGLSWKRIADQIRAEAESKGFDGRFGAGLPRVNDGSFLFLQHMVSKMKPVSDGGSRVAIVFNGSPLFTGAAGSGESEIRRWIIQNDLLEAVVAMPDELFYNTGVAIYLWIVTNRKNPQRRGTIQLLDARRMFVKMRKSLGAKRKQISDTQTDEIVRAYVAFAEAHGHDDGVGVKVFPNESFNQCTGDRATGQRPDYRIAPWMFLPSVGANTHLPIAAFSSVNPERASATGAETLLTAKDLGTCRTSSDLTLRSGQGVRYSVCGSGDLVGNASGWRLLPDDFGRALTSLDVIRLADEFRHASELLRVWLLSPECILQLHGPRGTIPRDLRVPRALLEDKRLSGAMATVVNARASARQLVDSLFEDPIKPSDFSMDIDPAELLEHAARADAVVQLLQPLNDPFHRAEWSYPIQIAHLARQYRLAQSIDKQVESGVRLADALARQLGVLAGASIRKKRPDKLDGTLELFRGGISTGDWLRIVQDAQNLEVLSDLPELAALSFRKKGTGGALDAALQIRNRGGHAHGVATEAILKERLEELEPLLVAALEDLVWLSSVQQLSVRSCYVRDSRAGLEIDAELLSGAHPVWEPRSMQVAMPIAPRTVVAFLPNVAEPLELAPFLCVQTCAVCKREEAYILERVQANGSLRGRSIRDHETDIAFAKYRRG